MIIGEAPGRNEDRTGKAFVGLAGQLLNQLLQAARIPEGLIYFCNLLKCRPPDNRFPDDDAPLICRAYLFEQIRLIQPRAIVLAGKHALEFVLLEGTHEEAQPISAWVNKHFRRRDRFGDIRFTIVYHPSYLLRNEIEEDQEACIQTLGEVWAYTRAKVEGTTPPVTPFRDLRPAPKVHRQGRNLFGFQRGDVL